MYNAAWVQFPKSSLSFHKHPGPLSVRSASSHTHTQTHCEHLLHGVAAVKTSVAATAAKEGYHRTSETDRGELINARKKIPLCLFLPVSLNCRLG